VFYLIKIKKKKKTLLGGCTIIKRIKKLEN